MSNDKLHANSIESTSALLPLSPVDVVVAVVCVEVLLADIALESAESRTAAVRLAPPGGVVCASAFSVEDGCSAGSGDGGADGLRDVVGSSSWSPRGQSVDVVDSGALLGRSDAVLPG